MNELTYQARCCVYFIQNEQTGLVKIGYTAEINKRFASIRNNAGSSVVLLRTVDGGRATESWFHKRFSDLRVYGEWFRFNSDMLSAIPPDELPKRERVIKRRDIRLTLRERVAAAEAMGADCGLSARLVLTTIVGQMSEDEAAEVIGSIRELGA